MSFFNKKYASIYLFALLVQCISILFILPQLRILSKLLLIPILLIFFINTTNSKNNTAHFWIPILALIGSFIGDFLLVFNGDLYFLFGMLGFMITHICNTYNFLSYKRVGIRGRKYTLTAVLFLIVLCGYIFHFIANSLGVFYFPIIIYMLLIAIMALSASQLADSKLYFSIALRYCIPGAFLFVISDSLLAINKFGDTVFKFDFLVMLSYGLAQFLIVLGFLSLEQLATKKSPDK